MGNQSSNTQHGRHGSSSEAIHSIDGSPSDTLSPFQSASSSDSEPNNNLKHYHPEEEAIVTQATQYSKRPCKIPKVSRAASVNGIRRKRMFSRIPGFAAVSNNGFLSLASCNTLRESWQTVLEVHGGDQTKIGLAIYSRIFKRVPELRDCFMIPKEIVNVGDYEPFVRSALLLSSVIALCIRNIEGLESEMGPVLVMYGRRHYHREKQGFSVSYIPVFAKCIIEYIGDSLGDNRTPETDLAWQKLLSYINAKLVEGVGLEKYRVERQTRKSTSS